MDTSATQSSSIIFGGKFFQEFFGVFTNDYHSQATPDQSAQIFLNENAIYTDVGYLGNAVLPTGVNPFRPLPPPTPTPDNTGLGTVWIVVIVLIGVILLGFLGFLLYKYRQAVEAAEKNRGSNVVYDITAGKVNASDANEIPSDERKLLE